MEIGVEMVSFGLIGLNSVYRHGHVKFVLSKSWFALIRWHRKSTAIGNSMTLKRAVEFSTFSAEPKV